jgi:hypothetical protein
VVKTWVWVLGISVAVVLASWGVMVLLAAGPEDPRLLERLHDGRRRRAMT